MVRIITTQLRSFSTLVLSILVFAAVPSYAALDLQVNPVGNINIGKNELGYRLMPLTKKELTATVEHWITKLQRHLEKIAELQIKLSSANKDEVSNLQIKLQNLNLQRTEIIAKTKQVMTELQKKGGDIKDYEQYIAAVSLIKPTVHTPQTLLIKAKSWVLSPERGMQWTLNAGLFLTTLVAFKILATIFAAITRKSVSRVNDSSALLKSFLVNLVKNLTLIIGFMLALTMLEVDIGPLLAALGATGFIVGFALQGTLSNFASGLMILIYRPYDIGNVVNVAGTTGTVESMTLVSTTLKLPDNQQVVIPNNAIWGSTITNITGNSTRRIDMVFGIGYQDDILQAEYVLTTILTEHPLVLKDPEPVIKVHELADSSVNFVVRPWVKTEDYFSVYWDVTRSVKQRFDEEGINIPYPQREIHMASS